MKSEVLSSVWLKDAAHQAGFDLCGFARAEPIPSHVLGDWLAAGMHADMDWLERRLADRLDVRGLLPSARTVVALACNYHVDAHEKSPIARYARGRDYHHTLKDRLRAFRRLLRDRHPWVEDYGCVDTGPVMEKIWAVRAGLGHVGKNGCLITEKFGSYVLLAVLILGAQVDAYAPGPGLDRCGTCSLCVMSCPTSALNGEGGVDARLCLSYQTIENEAEIPSALRPAMENLVFGCDICQDVCPLNRAPVDTQDPRFAPRAVAALGVRELAALTPEQYQTLIPGTPLARAQYDGLRRNAAYALGAGKDEEAKGILEALSRDPVEKVRNAALWALEQLKSARV